MDVLLSAVASDLIGRLISFLIQKYQNPGTTGDCAANNLQRLLLRARVVVEEAEGRQIASRAMLQQLNQLRRELYRAAYAIDTFRRRAVQVDRKSHATVSRFGSHAGPQPSSSDFLSVMVKSLEGVLTDMKEFVVLLNGCPRVTLQPYSAYLFMESCMFGRQMEKEEIISFLLQPSQDLDVLPIIGPHEVGKRTLVEHACIDERIQERFTKIHHLSSNDLDDFPQIDRSLFDFSSKSLTVINMVDDNDPDAEESWRRFYSSAVRHRVHNWSKIVVISRSESHSSLGTAPPLRLRAPHREELWYFFRALAFGAADPDEHPNLVRIAMELCDGITDFAPYAAANIIATALRADISARSWHRVRKMGDKARMLQLDAANDRLDEYYKKVGRYYLWRPLRDLGVPCMFSNRRKLNNVERNRLPEVTMPELIAGSSIRPRPPAGETRFDMLVWESRIPPYASYVATCDLERSRQLLTAAKRARKRRRDRYDDHQQRCV